MPEYWLLKVELIARNDTLYLYIFFYKITAATIQNSLNWRLLLGELYGFRESLVNINTNRRHKQSLTHSNKPIPRRKCTTYRIHPRQRPWPPPFSWAISECASWWYANRSGISAASGPWKRSGGDWCTIRPSLACRFGCQQSTRPMSEGSGDQISCITIYANRGNRMFWNKPRCD